MSKEPNRNVYVGHRYVPKIMGEWNNKNEYEGLSIVSFKGNSYTSKKRVPPGIDILNKEFWANTGNYNSQIEYYRNETERIRREINELEIETNKKYNVTDNKINKVNADLTGKIKTVSDDVINVNKDITTINNDLENKIDHGDVSVSDINKNKGKIDQTYLSDDLIQSIAGDTPINSVPADNSITSDKLVDQSVTQFKLADLSVSETKLRESAVGRDKIKNGAVTQSKLSNNAVTKDSILDKTITGDKIDDLAIKTDNLDNFSVSNGKVINGAITRGKLSDSFMFNGRIAPNESINDIVKDGYYIIEAGNIGDFPETLDSNSVYVLNVKVIQGWVHQELTKLETPELRFIRWVGLSSGTVGKWKSLMSNDNTPNETIKILMIGNSFSHNISEELIKMFSRSGLNAVVGVVYKVNESLEGLYNNTLTGDKDYTYYERTSDSGLFNTRKFDNYSLEDCIDTHSDWNIITFQQRSTLSTDYETYQPYLNDLISFVRSVTPADFETALIQTWADSTSRTPEQIEMYNGLVSAYNQAFYNEDFNYFVPIGTAIQNARTDEYLLNADNELTADGYHLSDLGKQVAGLTMFKVLVSPYYNIDINSIKSKPKDVTNYQDFKGKIAVKNAVLRPDHITEI